MEVDWVEVIVCLIGGAIGWWLAGFITRKM
jgi:hypothetical protein